MADNSTLVEIPVINGTSTSNPWTKIQSTPVNDSKSSCPWGKKITVNSPSLHDVMQEQLSEQVAVDLQAGEEFTFEKDISTAIAASAADAGIIEETAPPFFPDTSNDEEIARMLQQSEDEKMFDLRLSMEAAKFNGSSKVSISFEKYKTYKPMEKDEDDEDLEFYEVQETKSPWEKASPTIGSKGFSGKGRNITTKHDKVICGRRNAQRLMNDLPEQFETGDSEGMDLQLSNQVYNGLKRQVQTENKRALRLTEPKDQATSTKAIDPKTSMLLMKLINNNVLQSGYSVISSGKESVIFYAPGGSNEELKIPKECAVKVFKTTLNEFKDRQKYVHGDRRFFKDDFKKQNPRKIIKLWADKEQYNLNRMRKFKIPCPGVVALKKHLLVMEFIGEDSVPAPKIKDALLSPESVADAYQQTVKIMETMYASCNLVHADLSEYNLLWFKNSVYVIDVSQAVDYTHPKAHEFLCRDCRNICKFFEKSGATVLTPEQLFNQVTGLNIEGEGALFEAQVRRHDKERRDVLEAQGQKYKEYAFDFFFDKSQQERIAALENLPESDSEEEENDEEGEGNGEEEEE